MSITVTIHRHGKRTARVESDAGALHWVSIDIGESYITIFCHTARQAADLAAILNQTAEDAARIDAADADRAATTAAMIANEQLRKTLDPAGDHFPMPSDAAATALFRSGAKVMHQPGGPRGISKTIPTDLGYGDKTDIAVMDAGTLRPATEEEVRAFLANLADDGCPHAD